MKQTLVVVAFSLSALLASGATIRFHQTVKADTNVLGIVLSDLEKLQKSITADKTKEAALWEKYSAWCSATASSMETEHTKEKMRCEDLDGQVSIAKEQMGDSQQNINEMSGQLTGIAADIAKDQKEYDTKKGEAKQRLKELDDTIAALIRAVDFLESEIAKHKEMTQAALFAQINSTSMSSMMNALTTLVQAASLDTMISTGDHTKLTAFIQQFGQLESDSNDDLSLDAPVYKRTKSADIVKLMEELKGKAVQQHHELDKATRQTLAAIKDRIMLAEQKQSRVDSKIKDEKKAVAHYTQQIESLGRQYGVCKQGLTRSGVALRAVVSGCKEKSDSHETSVEGFDEELKVIGEALSTLQEMTSEAKGAASFLQIQEGSSLTNREVDAGTQVLALVQSLARKDDSLALAALASKIKSLVRFGARSGKDVFETVRELIQGLMSKLQAQQDNEQSEAEFCRENLKKTKENKAAATENLKTTQSEYDTAKTEYETALDELTTLEGELASANSELEELRKDREAEKSEYSQNKRDLDAALSGTAKAKKLLEEYYAEDTPEATTPLISDPLAEGEPEAPTTHAKKSDAGNAIVGLLSTIYADLVKSSAALEQKESEDLKEFNTLEGQLKVTKIEKEGSIKNKRSFIEELQKEVGEAETALDRAKSTLDTETKLLENLKERCTVVPATYEQNKLKIEKEIAGLKKAKVILEEASMIQSATRSLRGRSVATDI